MPLMSLCGPEKHADAVNAPSVSSRLQHCELQTVGWDKVPHRDELCAPGTKWMT